MSVCNKVVIMQLIFLLTLYTEPVGTLWLDPALILYIYIYKHRFVSAWFNMDTEFSWINPFLPHSFQGYHELLYAKVSVIYISIMAYPRTSVIKTCVDASDPRGPF